MKVVDFKRSCRGFTLVELLVVLAIFFFFVFMFPWTFKAFVFWGTLTSVLGVLSIIVAFRRGWKAFLVALIPVIGCLVPFVLMVPTVYPMQFARLQAGHYENVPLVKVLSDISLQKANSPYWRFHIEDRELAEKRISVDLPDGCRLGEAMKLIAERSNCEMKWNWHKFCGNEPSPICASICFLRHGADLEKFWDTNVMIERDSIFGLEEKR